MMSRTIAVMMTGICRLLELEEEGEDTGERSAREQATHAQNQGEGQSRA